MTVLAVDYGLSKIGFACSNASASMALPMGTLQTHGWSVDRQAEQTLEKAIDKRASVIVVGLPLHLDGNKSAQTTKTELFITKLSALADQKKTGIEIKTFDERLTSKQADRLLQEVCRNRKERDRRSDETSAYLILDTYLNQLRLM